ncbi:HupE/UreJ family protein [Bradyrhizobium sp. CB82]|uniref:HupE/UreJ family protein n=1 Tax=Bradyrhizobium sp. CB82 TaxID=3039159 RepID=UPI0024B1B0C4|nr:HupE/UreJ family protein [Bradyrhizobium sp. CB82]WFU43571.1 HupE/UreJ family protein [Bradyrhizobium sp. CB82]
MNWAFHRTRFVQSLRIRPGRARLNSAPAKSTSRAWLALASVAVAAGATWETQAHNAGVSTSRIVIHGRTVDVEINALGRDYEKAAGIRITEAKSGEVNRVALAIMAPSIFTYVGDQVAVFAGRQRCAPTPGTARPAETHVLVTVAWACPLNGGELRYRATLFHDVDPAARHLAIIATESGERELAIDSRAPEVALSGAGSSVLQVVWRFVQAGIEHIFLGYDHVAFLAAIMLWARRLWPVIKIVTAFTIAHSITLSLAALQIVVFPSTIVEPAIAATIIFVVVENFFSRNVDGRWRVTFVFGLIHGFGFASALQEIGLPAHAAVPALMGFNIGVEIGQVVIVALIFPLLLWSDRIGQGAAAGKGRHPAVVYFCSAAILLVGLYWLIERTVLP